MTANSYRVVGVSALLIAVCGSGSAQPTCAVPTAATVFIEYRGTTPQCNQLNGVCVAGDTVEFSIRTLPPVTPECASSVSWHIGGQQLSGTTIQYTFGVVGTYHVSATVQNAQFSFSPTVTVNVISAPPLIPTLSFGALMALISTLVGVALVALKR
ncbi:MAG TPA: PKD domain-containing protein [Thermoanaerobaculia bacterium]|nr:PKD domain-containing protein [Thermoanaerobaculia bacterium]